MSAGHLCFVLHSHIPYVRKSGVWPFGEEWLFEVMADSYIPLLNMLSALPPPKKPYVSVGLTPVLLEQLQDNYIKSRFEQYLFQRLDLCAKDMERHRDRPERQALARMYEKSYHNMLFAFRDIYHRDLVSAFRKLQTGGRVELLASAATHGYLPLLGTETAIRAQVKIGVDCYDRAFGNKPKGIWLPECAYRPAGKWKGPDAKEPVLRPGIEKYLAECGVNYFLVDHHTIEGGSAEGLYRERFPFTQPLGKMPTEPSAINPSGKTTYRPYYVKSNGSGNVAVFGRNEKSGLQVWSGEWGYPGDGWYREFHKRDSVSGLQYWRVTDRQSRDLGTKAFYEPEKTQARVDENAMHFVGLVKELLSQQKTDAPPIVVAPYDSELFGHWWFEGIRWMKKVLESLPAEGIEPVSCGSYLAEHPPTQMITLPESSWGAGGDHRIWLNQDTEWMWTEIHACERWMEEAAGKHIGNAALKPLLEQAARELLLLESSDWEFLITTFQAKEYGIKRFKDHLERFRAIQAAVEGRGTVNIEELMEQDKLFKTLDVSVYRPG